MAIWIKVRATAEQRDTWYEKARLKGVTFSELARHALDGTRVRRRQQLRRIEPELLRQLARLGNNLNQLARWANRDQRYAESAAVLARLVEIDRELLALRKLYQEPVLEGAGAPASGASKDASDAAQNEGSNGDQIDASAAPRTGSDPVPKSAVEMAPDSAAKPASDLVVSGGAFAGENEGVRRADGGAQTSPAARRSSGRNFAGDEGRDGPCEAGDRTATPSCEPVSSGGTSAEIGGPEAPNEGGAGQGAASSPKDAGR